MSTNGNFALRTPDANSHIAAASAGVRLHRIEKSFDGNRVLRGVDLDIAPGSFVAIIGKSGCGKSTLLRILMGLDGPTAGRLEFYNGGRRPLAPEARIVFQEPRLLPWASVLDNVIIGLGGNDPLGEARRRAREALDAVELSAKESEWPARLSGGQRQRVALARALVSRPGFLALDEPLGALDALTRISMQRLLAQVWRELGFTAVLVTHDVAEAVHLADRVIVLDDGRVKLDQPVHHAHPRRHGKTELAEIEGNLLSAILGE